MRGLSPADIYAVVTDFDAYPRLFKEMKTVKVLSTDGNRKRVEFHLEMVIAIRYVLDLVCDAAAGTVDWTYVEGEIVTDSRGGWRFSAEGDGSKVDYQAALTINAPLPGFVVKKVTNALVSASLPAMFTSIENEARSRKRLSS
jgi:coenzyme Q-binding protein COQ10